MQNFLSQFHTFINSDLPLFHIGKSQFTLGQLLTIIIGSALVFLIARLLNRLIANRLLAHSSHVDLSTRYTIAALVRYAVLVIGFMLVMQAAGINLTAFSVLAGAVGVGIGFGLQNIVSNFISGLIVMFERPVRIGDRIELGGVEGDVVKIGARATRIRTSEGAVVIMPNQKFITDPVKNWADHEERSPIVLNVNVEKSSNLNQVTEILNATVQSHPHIAQQPAMQIWLAGISGAATFKIVAWTNGNAQERNKLTHELYLAISDSFTKSNIVLA